MSSDDRTLLLIGATDTHLERAKASGLRIVLIQHPERVNPLQTGLADVLLMADYTHWPTVRPLAEAARQIWGVDAVLSLTEGGLENAARLGRLFGLRGTPPEAARLLRDKAAMRRHLAAHGCPFTVESEPVVDRASLDTFGKLAGYPFIVKPTGTTAGYGVHRVDDEDGLDAAWQHVERLRGRHTDHGTSLFLVDEFLMEAYIDGPEFSVEGFSHAGRHTVVTITEKLVDERHFAELGHALPARLPAADRDAIVATVTEFLTVMGLSDGPSHTEIRLSGRGPVVIESHNRGGGDFIGELVRAAYGIDLTGHAVAWAAGTGTPLPADPQPLGAACVRFLTGEPGTVTAVGGTEELAERPGVLAARITAKPGDRVRPLRDNWDRLGFVAVRADDTEAAVARCERLIGDIRIDIDKSN
ncbi:ATP-grasp domain-containing protein [Actinoplanes sp. KI2]|uniref:ATP-grasp domain-containing protein n=1 Tax=Actinoplanes sp. KI2 TaxID=2983315 RepID=UPI0021D5F653|nr:ATP-grasp domain-containing protein [Actinoplanes sp. KI2]MCU7727443.1 ATP-grasp domain-containing protein [Actinoplanes sp. KI2]